MQQQPQTEQGTKSGPDRSVWTWLLPALALVAGVALGASLVAAGTAGDGEEPRAQATASPEPTDPATGGDRTASDDLVVRVPGVCLDAAESAQEVAAQMDDVAAAVGALDARRLQELVDRFQQLQPRIQQQADQCRAVTGGQAGDLARLTPAPSPAS